MGLVTEFERAKKGRRILQVEEQCESHLVNVKSFFDEIDAYRDDTTLSSTDIAEVTAELTEIQSDVNQLKTYIDGKLTT